MAGLIFDNFQFLKVFCSSEKLICEKKCHQDDARYLLKFSSLQRMNATYERIASKTIIQPFAWRYINHLLYILSKEILLYYPINIKLMKNMLVMKNEIETYECILN